MIQYKMFFRSNLHTDSKQHQTLTAYGKVCMQNNQLLIKTPVGRKE